MPAKGGSTATRGSRRSDEALERIIGLIRTGQFAPGERLPAERELADSLQVSRPTLRDALNRLEARGYVDRRTGSGNYVCSAVPDEVRTPLLDGIRERVVSLQQIIDVRKPLEVWGAREAARRRTSKQVSELKRALADMRVSGRKVDPESNSKYGQADIRFHLVIAAMTGNPVYLHTIQFLTDLISKSLAISREILDTDFNKANTERHKSILGNIVAGDATAAGRAMAGHFVLIERRIKEIE